jgi:hypothetical protein
MAVEPAFADVEEAADGLHALPAVPADDSEPASGLLRQVASAGASYLSQHFPVFSGVQSCRWLFHGKLTLILLNKRKSTHLCYLSTDINWKCWMWGSNTDLLVNND